MVRSLIFLGIRLHNLGPVYLMECLPYVVVLNLGMANSLFLNEYLVSVIWKRSVIYFGQMFFFVLYTRTENYVISTLGFSHSAHREGNSRHATASYESWKLQEFSTTAEKGTYKRPVVNL